MENSDYQNAELKYIDFKVKTNSTLNETKTNFTNLKCKIHQMLKVNNNSRIEKIPEKVKILKKNPMIFQNLQMKCNLTTNL